MTVFHGMPFLITGMLTAMASFVMVYWLPKTGLILFLSSLFFIFLAYHINYLPIILAVLFPIALIWCAIWFVRECINKKEVSNTNPTVKKKHFWEV